MQQPCKPVNAVAVRGKSDSRQCALQGSLPTGGSKLHCKSGDDDDSELVPCRAAGNVGLQRYKLCWRVDGAAAIHSGALMHQQTFCNHRHFEAPPLRCGVSACSQQHSTAPWRDPSLLSIPISRSRRHSATVAPAMSFVSYPHAGSHRGCDQVWRRVRQQGSAHDRL